MKNNTVNNKKMSDEEEPNAKQIYLDQVPEGKIFSIIGTYGRPYLKFKNGYADMTNAQFYERQNSTENHERCRLLDEKKLRWKYRINEDVHNSISWLESWKQQITIKVSRACANNSM